MILMLLVVVIVAIAIVAARHTGTTSSRPAGASGSGSSAHRSGPAEFDLDDALGRWRRADLLSDDQVQAIRGFEADLAAAGPAPRVGGHGPRSARSSRVPLAAEALGYLGGVLAGVGAVLVVARFWNDLAVAGQVVLTAGASAVLGGVGALVGRLEDPAFDRMRTFLWSVSSAAAGAGAVVVVRSGFGSDDPTALTLGGAAAVALHSGALWRFRRLPVQQAIALGATVVSVGALTALVAPAGWWGFSIWVVGAALTAVGLTRRGSSPVLTEAIGAVSMVVGGITVASTWESGGPLFLVATALGLASVALVPLAVPTVDRWVLGGIGAVAMVISVPATIGYYAYEAGALVGAVVWVVGGGLLWTGLSDRVHLPLVAQAVGSVTMLVGAGVVGAQWPSIAPAAGLVTAIGLLVVGSRPGAVLESLMGALGLLVFVPLSVARWFPGESRAPILLVVSGLVILAVAFLIGRLGGRMRRELSTGGP